MKTFIIIKLIFIIILLSAIWNNSPNIQKEVKDYFSGYTLLIKALEK